MKSDVIIQARLQSTRLPNKVLMEVGDTTLLGQVIRKAQAIAGVDEVCVAMPELPGHQELENEATRHGAWVYKGSESDVLARYYGAAKELKSDVITRVTADCPFLNPKLTAAMIALQAHTGADYVTNNMPLTWPHGTETETFTFKALEKCQSQAITPFQREHVTVLLREREDVQRVNLMSDNHDLIEHRWTVDYPEDLDFARKIYNALGDDGDFSYQEVISYLKNNAEIMKINAHHGHYEADEPWVQSYRIVNWSNYFFEQSN